MYTNKSEVYKFFYILYLNSASLLGNHIWANLSKYQMILFDILFFWKKKKLTNEIPFDKKLDLEIQQLSENTQKEGENTFDHDSFNSLNIMVAGKSGVGKSTLINSFFREELTETGIGRPFTQEISYYSRDDFPLSIYDVPGLELDEKTQKKLIDKIFNTIKTQHSTKDPKKYIHCLWYCISCTSKRYEQSEIDFIKTISKNPNLGNIPFFIIITQCYNENDRDQFIMKLKEENLSAREIIPVLAKEQIININGKREVISPYGLDNIVSLMKEYLPDFLQNTLDNIKIIAFKSLKLKARLAIGVASSAAFAVAGDFIPYADASYILPIEISMLKLINYIYDVNILQKYMDNFLRLTLGATGIFGKKADIVSSIHKQLNTNPFIGNYKPIFNDILIGNRNIYIESNNTISKYKHQIQDKLQDTFDTINDSINDLAGWFNGLKGSPKLAIPTAAVTSAIGETYRQFIEYYCLHHDMKLEKKIKKEIQATFKKEFKKQSDLIYNEKLNNDL